MWKKNLGIECTLENQEWAVFQSTKRKGDFEMAREDGLPISWIPMSLLAIFESDNNFNDPAYSNPEYDALLEKARNTVGEEHYKALYAAQKILVHDFPIIPLYYYNSTWLSSPHVKNWKQSMLGKVDFSEAWIEK